MRFRNGFWHLDDGVTLYSEKNCFECEESEGKLSLYASLYPISCRNDTLNNPVITTEISAISENILRVDVYHHKGVNEEKPFPLIPSGDATAIGNDFLASGDLKAEVRDGNLTFTYKGKEITKRFSRLSGYMTTPNGNFMAEYLTTDIGETYYGLGERFTSFVKNGQKVEMWNLDSGFQARCPTRTFPSSYLPRTMESLSSAMGRYPLKWEAKLQNVRSFPYQERDSHTVSSQETV